MLRRYRPDSAHGRPNFYRGAMPLRYVPYDQLGGRPSVIVDGSPAEGTVLTLSHWPGTPCPPGLEADLSAEMAFLWLDAKDSSVTADAVSNNHFDQDGLVSVFALSQPAAANERRELLIDLAAAGDFGTFRHRTAARASMAIAGYTAAGGSSPGDPYEEMLARVAELVDRPEVYRELWEEEDAELTTSEEAIRSGAVTIEEREDIDLAVVTVGAAAPHLSGGHRFAHIRRTGPHPMAVFNATDRFAVATINGDSYGLEYRYETWVQYRSRPPRQRRDLTALAAELNERDPTGDWKFEGVGALTPRLLRQAGPGAPFSTDVFLSRLARHLETGPPAWNPYPG